MTGDLDGFPPADGPLDRRLVIAGCSRRKKPAAVPVPALELYQGGSIPWLRARLGEHPGLRQRVRILSAEHGLLTADSPVLPYDRPLRPRHRGRPARGAGRPGARAGPGSGHPHPAPDGRRLLGPRVVGAGLSRPGSARDPDRAQGRGAAHRPAVPPGARGPDRVITNSEFLISQAAGAGLDVTGWAAVPNALLTSAEPPPRGRREELRRRGPARIAVRAEPHKAIAELIAAIPPGLDRDVEIALAAVAFEYWPGMLQDQVMAGCAAAARTAPARVRLLPALGWRDVPRFFAGAAVTIIATTSPESWCNAAAEALSAGTPVIAYDFGHVPVLTGPAGVMITPGQPPDALWAAATRLLADPGAYHAAATAAPGQVRPHTPAASAAAFLSAVT